MSAYLVEQLGSLGNVTIHIAVQASRFEGTDHLERAVFASAGDDELSVDLSAVFVFIGQQPRTAWLGDAVARDERGFVLSGSDVGSAQGWKLHRAPYLLESSMPGVFAAGDVRHRSVKRIASAVGEGSMAVQFVHQYLAGL
jgi:thioredoxin reductase (NADPH)